MKTCMFPGQGSQASGMGGTLFDEFSDLTKKADDILGYSVKELCLHDAGKNLNNTEFTQPALYVVNALAYYKRLEEGGEKPDFVIGHSLGEFNALLAAGCFEFETGLELVRNRGQLMSQATDGAMAAVINATKEEIESILKENDLHNIDLANYNTPSQIVISGLREEISRARSCFQNGKILYIPLNTSGAFHSRYMQEAGKGFESCLKTCRFSDPVIPVISNVTAKPYKNGEVMMNLARQLTSPVRWTDSIQYLMAVGVERDDRMEFEEVGHGEVLTRLVQKISRETPRPSPVKSQADAAAATIDRQEGEVSRSGEGDGPAAPNGGLHEVIGKLASAEEKVAAWNEHCRVGTKVRSLIIDDDDLETRTEAVVLFGHRAAVYMKGYKGYFDLDEITPL